MCMGSEMNSIVDEWHIFIGSAHVRKALVKSHRMEYFGNQPREIRQQVSDAGDIVGTIS